MSLLLKYEEGSPYLEVHLVLEVLLLCLVGLDGKGAAELGQVLGHGHARLLHLLGLLATQADLGDT